MAKKIKAGSKSDHPCIFYDYFATVCDIIGAELDYKIDGKSYLPSLLVKNQKEHDFLYWEFPSYTGQQAIRSMNGRVSRRNYLKVSKLKLYNLDRDPKELNDLSPNYPDVVKKIESL